MTMPIGPRAMPLAPPNPKSSDDERLRKTAQQLEGLFVQQLYKSMRATVPQGEGVVDGGSGEEMFTGLMDEKLAADTPSQWEHGLASAAYRQLRGAVARQSAAPDPTTPPALKLDPSR